MECKAQEGRQKMNRTNNGNVSCVAAEGAMEAGKANRRSGALGCGGGVALCCKWAGKDSFAGRVPHER